MTGWAFALCSFALCLPRYADACTAYKVTVDGRTLVGNHEDAWSINARVRFVNGGVGELGAIYFSHYNGSPLRRMSDQGGMNEAGLVFDGFIVPVTDPRRQHGKPIGDHHALIAQAMRTCSDVHQVATLFNGYDLRALNGGMLFFCDRNGEYLLVEADTLFTGKDATYALGNFRASQCTDLNAVPIERYQRGRRMLAAGPDTSVAWCTAVLDSMHSCRKKLGNGTLYSYLADPSRGVIHLFFYHDFTHPVTFDLKKELAKGDHELGMASLFPVNAEFEQLLQYRTPFHQRWLWWTVVGIGALSIFTGIWAFVMMLIWVLACIRSRTLLPELSWLAVGVGSATSLFLCGTLLMIEGVYYFGLGDDLDKIHPLLKWSPWLLLACTIAAGVYTIMQSRNRVLLRVHLVTQCLLILGLAYWGLFWS